MVFQTLWNSQWNYDIFFSFSKPRTMLVNGDKIKMWPIPCVVPGIWNFQIIMTLVEKSKMTVFQPGEGFPSENLCWRTSGKWDYLRGSFQCCCCVPSFHLLLWEIKISEFFSTSSWDMDYTANFWAIEITTMLHWRKSWRLENKGQDL